MDTQLLEAPLFRPKKEAYDFDIEDDVQNLFDEMPDELVSRSNVQQESDDHNRPPAKKRLSKKLVRVHQSNSPPVVRKQKGKRLLAKSSSKKQKLNDSESDMPSTPLEPQDSPIVDNEDSLVSAKAKKVKGKKVSKKEQVRMKRQEKMKEWEAQFGAEEKDEPQEAKQIYYTGMQFQKDQKPVIKRANKMMNSLDLDLDVYDKERKEDGDLVVDIKPRQVTKSIDDFRFFRKAEKLMINRQSQRQNASSTASYNNDDSAAKRNKQSLNKLITSSQMHQDVDLDLKVNIPCFARGKSNQLLNSTLYLKRLSSLENSNLDSQPIMSSNSLPEPIVMKPKKRKTMTRRELFSNISRDIRKRKSQTLTLQEIRSSFRKTDLSELDVLKKTIQDKKKKKFGPVDSDPNDSDFQMEAHMGQLEKDQNLKEELNSEVQVFKLQGQQSNTCKVKQEVAAGQAGERFQNSQEQDATDSRLLVQQEIESIGQNHSKSQSHQLDEIIQNPIDEEEYNRLLRMDEDQNSQQDMSLGPQDDEDQDQDENENEDDNRCQSIEADDEDQGGDSAKGSSEVDGELDLGRDDPYERVVPEGSQDSRPKVKQEHPTNRSKNKTFLDEDDEEAESQDNKLPNQLPTQAENEIIHQVQQENYQSKNNSNAKMAFKNLKKMAVVISQKRKRAEEGRRKAGRYFDDEAQLGSDNEDNDFVRKIINKEQEEVEQRELGQDLDQQLQDLIDNAVYLNQSDEQAAFQKFLADERLRDKQELSRVIRGEFRNNKEYDRQFQDNDGDEQARNRRMDEVYEDMKRRDEEENAYYVYNKLVEGKKNASSQSESEQNQVNPFQQELKRKLDRQQALKKSLTEPTIFKKIKTITSQATVLEPQSDKKYSIFQQKMTKRGSLLSLQPAQIKKRQSSELERFYHKDQNFPAATKVFKFGGKNGAWTINK